MNIIIIEIILVLIAYWIGSFSFARILSKIFRNINIYKVGNFTADASNVYHNVSKPLGILVWILDFARIYISLWIVHLIFLKQEPELLLLVGFSMIIGHYFPIMHKFKGARGIFAYSALLFYFAWLPTLVVGVASFLVVLFFHQIRFAKYMMVIMVPIICYILKTGKVWARYLLLASIVMGIIHYFVSKGYGDI